MQLLLLLLLLSMQGGAIGKEIQPLLETMGGEDLKNVLGEAESIAEAIGLVKPFIPEAQVHENPQPTSGSDGAKSEINFPLAAVSSFADSEIIGALSEFMGC